MTDDEKLEEARKGVDLAIREFFRVRDEVHETDPTYVMAWVAYAEYVNVDLQARELTQSRVITPKDQLVSTSIGLLELGKTSFFIRKGD